MAMALFTVLYMATDSFDRSTFCSMYTTLNICFNYKNSVANARPKGPARGPRPQPYSRFSHTFQSMPFPMTAKQLLIEPTFDFCLTGYWP